jgi:hypothetical protein
MVSANDDSLKISGWLGKNNGEAGLKIPTWGFNIPRKRLVFAGLHRVSSY